MPKSTIISAAIFAILTAVGVSVGGTAHAAVTTPLTVQTLHSQSMATPVYWVYRHHRRYWVEDRRRRYYR